MNKLGIMQGRLLPKYKGRYQAHPVNQWQKEFHIGKEIGLDLIEFILDFEDAHLNPLLTDEGIREIQNLVNKTGVQVTTVCADYFMEAPLHHLDPKIYKKSRSILSLLIKNGRALGITDIVLPCVDQSSLLDKSGQDRFFKVLSMVLPLAEEANINMSLETDLGPQAFAELLDRFDSAKVTVNYDTGNSASLGYNALDEFAQYGNRISDIHIKDRIFGGGSVYLGKGDTDFKNFFEALSSINFNGPFIMQVYRDDEGLEIFKEQLTAFKEIMSQNNL